MPTHRQFSTALQALPELTTGQEAPPVDELQSVLDEIGRLPAEALFLGVAVADRLPVLLNLHDPHPGPMLVAGDAGSGKTAFLQTVAEAAQRTHAPEALQFGVITNYPDEWERARATPHRIGVFPVGHGTTHEFVRSLAAWAHSNKDTNQCVLLLVDDLESVASLDRETVQDFRWLLLRGPARRVWPVITLNAPRYGQVISWLQSFRTRVFGRVANARVAEALGGGDAAVLSQLEGRAQFTLRDKGGWLRFRLPSS